MKKPILSFILILLIFGPSLSASEREEVIVLFDTSVSVLPLYDELANLVLLATLETHIERGDSFHLLSFAAEPIYEFSQEIRGEEDRQKIRNYMEVLKPMGLHTDLIMALNFLYSFTRELSINTRKTILILTDGVHDAPPGAPSYGLGQEEVERLFREITEQINRQGWTVRILQHNAEKALSDLGAGIVGSPGEEVDSKQTGTGKALSAGEGEGSSSAGENYLDLMSEELKAPVTPFDSQGKEEELADRVMGVSRLTFPEDLGEVGRTFDFPIEITNYGKLAVVINLQEIQWQEINLLKDQLAEEIPPGESRTLRAKMRLPEEVSQGSHHLELTFLFGDGQEVLPALGAVNLTLEASAASRFSPVVFYAGGALLLLVVIIAVVVLIRRRIERIARKGQYQSQGASQEEDDQVSLGDFTGSGNFPRGGHQGKAGPKTASEEKKHWDQGKGTPHWEVPRKSSPKTMTTKSSEETWKVVKSGRGWANEAWGSLGAIEMKVEGQNPYLGHRNIRIVKEHSPIVVGGRGAPYHIFLYPVSSRLAELSYDGADYTLTPLIDEAFPGFKGPLRGCLDSWIPLKSLNGRVLRIKFIHWSSPLERLNWLMHIIDEPGIPKRWY